MHRVNTLDARPAAGRSRPHYAQPVELIGTFRCTTKSNRHVDGAARHARAN